VKGRIAVQAAPAVREHPGARPNTPGGVDVDEPTRACRKCKRALPLTCYYRDKRGPAGYRSNCKECHQADVMARYWANPESNRAQQAIYRADPEHRRIDRERSAQWRAEHPEWARTTVAAYRARPESKAAQRQRLRAWRLANPERNRELDRRRLALMRQFRNGASIPTELLSAKLAYWGGRCWIAGPGCTVEPTTWDHVKPLSKGGAHCLANLRPACASCNSSKRARWPYPVTGGPAWRMVV
jgi:5-methylcytosine-specific restriction endonuclease McrA